MSIGGHYRFFFFNSSQKLQKKKTKLSSILLGSHPGQTYVSNLGYSVPLQELLHDMTPSQCRRNLNQTKTSAPETLKYVHAYTSAHTHTHTCAHTYTKNENKGSIYSRPTFCPSFSPSSSFSSYPRPQKRATTFRAERM